MVEKTEEDAIETLSGSPEEGESREVPELLKEPEKELVMAVLSTEGCPPCETLSKALEVLREKYSKVDFKEFKSGEGEELRDFARDNIILLSPTVLISDGKRLMKIVGGSKSVQNAVEIYSELFESYLSDEIEFDPEEGVALVEEGFKVPVEVIE